MQTIEITEYNLEGQGTLVLRLENDLLGISADPEIILTKHELKELLDKLSSIYYFMALPIEDENE